MKLKKRAIILIGVVIAAFLIAGSIIAVIMRLNVKSPVDMTLEYMKKYTKLDSSVVNNIKYEFSDVLTESQKKKYEDIMKRQYENMSFEITEKVINETDAIITVEVIVYDFASAMSKANSYVEVYNNKFIRGDKFDEYAAIDYKLNSLYDYQEKVTYAINFYYYLNDDKWVLTELSDTDLKKINGTY